MQDRAIGVFTGIVLASPLAACGINAEDLPPPPDIDTGDATEADTGADTGDTGGPDVVNDGAGRGELVGVHWGSYPGAIVIGVPDEDQDTAGDAGEIDALVNIAGVGIGVPTDRPVAVVEEGHWDECAETQQYAFDLLADRSFGAAFTFYSTQIGVGVLDYEQVLTTAAPVAGSDSGRVMQYPAVGCRSCAMFPREPDTYDWFGNESGTLFGQSLAVGFFEHSFHGGMLEAREYLAVGAPAYGQGGGVHIFADDAYRFWLPRAFEEDFNLGEGQCDFFIDEPNQPFRLRTIEGQLQAGEEFGAALAVADFNCDGFDDLAVGAPGYDIPGAPVIEDAGALHIYWGGATIGFSGDQLIQGDFAVGGQPEEGDRFASVLAVGDFDGSRLNDEDAWTCWDLVVGTPDEDNAAGEVQVFFGSPGGLGAGGTILRLGEDDLIGVRDAGDRFGQALLAEDFNTPTGFNDLAIGAPGDEDGGSVLVVPGSDTGLRTERATQFVQGEDSLIGTNEAGDEFGAALGFIRLGTNLPLVAHPTVAVGAPGEDADDGAVYVIRLQDDESALVHLDSEVWKQGDMGLDEVEGDRFGSVIAPPRAFPAAPTSGFQVWRCEATTTLAAIETSCDTVPVSGTCPNGHVQTDPVPLPHVELEGGWDGWVVFSPPGTIRDAEAPSPSELALVTSICEAGCAAEYAENPHVTANCDASGAFETPTRVLAAQHNAIQTIPEAYRDGSGLMMGQSLTCDLLSDCCLGFDEDVCPAAPTRVTTAESQLARGEEYVVAMEGTLWLHSVDEDTYEQAEAIGVLGYSNCSGGNATAPCPIYFGSAHIETIETLAMEVDCDGDPYPLAMDGLTIDLQQPAMGINFEDSSQAGFPVGSLVYEAHASFGDFTFDARAINEDPVIMTSCCGWAQIQLNGGFKTELQLSCGHELKSFEAWFDLDGVEALEQPPLVEIDMPTSVACPSLVDLEMSKADPDGDEGAPRWEVDGVLLDSSVTSITVSQAHQLRVSVRDPRGATTTDTHMITCLP